MTSHHDDPSGPPPSVVAGKRRTPRARSRGATSERAYPAVQIDDDPDAVGAHLAATRALLSAATEDEVAHIVRTLVHDLGGGVVPARLTGTATALPLDVSLGLSEPLLPYAEPISVAAMRLSRILPTFVEDARSIVTGLRSQQRVADEAERDSVTGLLTRRSWMRRLGAATSGDTVCIIDLDHFTAVDDTAGHAAGDEVLGAIGSLLLRSLRTGDSAGRYGGDELACLAPGMPPDVAVRRLGQLRSSWISQRPPVAAGVGLSVGIASIDGRGPRVALSAADRALYRGKRSGRNSTATALADDYVRAVQP